MRGVILSGRCTRLTRGPPATNPFRARSFSSNARKLQFSVKDLEMEDTAMEGSNNVTHHLYERGSAGPSSAQQAEHSYRRNGIKKLTNETDPFYWHRVPAYNSSSEYSALRVIARELDYSNPEQVSKSRSVYDKTLLLVNNAEHTTDNPYNSSSPSLTGRGVGQALSLSRTACTFCNDKTGFVPDLVVVSPLQCSLETALFAMPYYAPHSVRAVPWVCHPAVATAIDQDRMQQGLPNNLQQVYEALDYSFGRRSNNTNSDQDCLEPIVFPSSSLPRTKAEDLLRRANTFLEWIQARPEQVIVVFTEAIWLQALGCIAGYERAPQVFGDGELRVVGIKYI